MTINIQWRPTKAERTISGTSEQLERLCIIVGSGGKVRCFVRPEHVPLLNAAAVASGVGFYSAIADFVLEHGTIEIWGEW